MKCEICGKEMSPHGISTHVLSHNITIQEYYDKYKRQPNEGLCLTCGKPTSFIKFSAGYEKYCSLECNPKAIICTCKICNKIINNSSGAFTNHIINEHNLSIKEYYDSYMKKENEGICKKCGGEAKFLDLSNGYHKLCNNCMMHYTYQEKICKICNKKVKQLGLHLNKSHPNINSIDYYNKYYKKENEGICLTCGKPTPFIDFGDGYAKYCSKECNPNSRTKEFICNICGKSTFQIGQHVKQHDIDPKDYYDMYFKQPGDGICKTCGKPTKFYSIIDGYSVFCSLLCSNGNMEIKDKKVQSYIEKYGVTNPYNIPEIQEKANKNAQLPNVKNHRKNTVENKYGGFLNGSPIIKEKIKQTSLERYGVENPWASSQARENAKNTWLNHFGVEYPWQAIEVREKMKETMLDKYGVENPMHSDQIKDKIKKNNLEKYGVEYTLQSPEIRDKITQNNLKKYGVANPWQSKEINDKIQQTKENNQNLDNELGDADE